MDFNALAIECAPMVAPQTLAAIVKTESNFNPLAININKGYRLERQPRNKDEAVATAKWLIANNYNIDMGLTVEENIEIQTGRKVLPKFIQHQSELIKAARKKVVE